MKVVLFCGGLGMRMREGEASAPKPMNMIGDRPLLWHVMRYYASYGHTEFVLCLGYGAAAVKDYFLRYDETSSNDFTLGAGGRDIRMHSTDITDWTISFIDTGLHSTIGERLMRVRSHVEGEEMFLANYADTLTDAPLDDVVDTFARSDSVVQMLAVPPVSTHHVVEIDPIGHVSAIREVRSLMQWENGGYFCMRPAIFDALREGEDMVPDGLLRLLDVGKLSAYRYEGFWRAADTFKDRVELDDMFRRGQSPWMVWDPQRSEAARNRLLRLAQRDALDALGTDALSTDALSTDASDTDPALAG
jgi:glucose-1-phosphate cytidylyltransferase